MEAQKIKEEFERNVKSFTTTGETLHAGCIIGVMNYACKNDANRRLVLKYLTGKSSSKFLTAAEWHALNELVKPTKPAGGHWMSERGEKLTRMCGVILAAVVDQPGQGKMFNE